MSSILYIKKSVAADVRRLISKSKNVEAKFEPPHVGCYKIKTRPELLPAAF